MVVINARDFASKVSCHVSGSCSSMIGSSWLTEISSSSCALSANKRPDPSKRRARQACGKFISLRMDLALSTSSLAERPYPVALSAISADVVALALLSVSTLASINPSWKRFMAKDPKIRTNKPIKLDRNIARVSRDVSTERRGPRRFSRRRPLEPKLCCGALMRAT